MANRIKGITVEIGGDTTGLNKALSGTNKQIRDTQSQLKDVERLLKLDPTNTELLAQKQRLLKEAVSQTAEKLDTLKEAEKQVQRQFEKGEIGRDQYDALKREIVSVQGELDTLNQKAKASNVTLQKLQSKAQGLAEGAGKVKSAMAPVTAAIAGLAGAAVATVPATEEMRDGLSKLEENAKNHGVAVDDAREAWRKFTIQSGEADSSIEAVSNLLQAGFTKSNLEKAVEGLAGAAQRFPDTLKIESLADSLQETLKSGKATGQFAEMLDRIGIGAEKFDGLLEDTTSNAEALDLVLRIMSKTGLNASYEGWQKNNEEMLKNREANLRFQESMAELAELVLPIVTVVTEKLSELITWFTELPSSTRVAIVSVLALVAAISPVAGIIESIGTVASFVAANPIVALIAAIVALVVAVAVFGDSIQNGLQKVDDYLQGIFLKDWTTVFGSSLGEPMNAFFRNAKNAWDAFKEILDGIIDFTRGVFTGDWDRAWTGVKEIFGGIFASLEGLAKAPLNGVIGLVNSLIGGLNWVIRKINSIGVKLGGKTRYANIGEIGKIPYLANGGIVHSGSAVVGEAGPELLTVSNGAATVTPLTNNTSNTNLGGVNITVYGAPGQDVDSLADILMDKFQAATERKGAIYGNA